MAGDRVGELLERLGRGDVSAAEELCSTYGPYLRAVVRGHLSDRLRARFDSADVVQSVWAHVVRQLAAAGWQVTSEARLRALLAVIARRRLATRARWHSRSLGIEGGPNDGLDLVPAANQPRPSEVAQADELWARLLDLCPPEHREVLRLRRSGLALTEVADRTGLHEGSVRRILRRLARELALRDRPLTTAACEPTS